MDKKEKYTALYIEAQGLVSGENDLIANLANITALIKDRFGFFWIGFYLVKDSQLVLGPFQGPVACTRIAHGKGVCGTSWAQAKALIVADVHEFPGHIACSAMSKSEIVLPVFYGKEVYMVLDIDSDELATFDKVDEVGLSILCELISENLPTWN
jgi:L-methionine (R)-S-oxide reductase